MKREKNIIVFHINETGGKISIFEYYSEDFKLTLLPEELTSEIVSRYKIDLDETVETFVKLVHQYGTHQQFSEYQPNFLAKWW